MTESTAARVRRMVCAETTSASVVQGSTRACSLSQGDMASVKRDRAGSQPSLTANT